MLMGDQVTYTQVNKSMIFWINGAKMNHIECSYKHTGKCTF